MTDTTGGAVAIWDPNSGAALPAYLADAMGQGGFETNIPDRNTVPSLSYEGKTWQIIKDGNRTKLQAQNSDGDMVPVPVMRVVLLNFNPDRGRAFYEGTYNPAASAAPLCWSADGKAPDPSVKAKQSNLCQGCPQSVKGSKIIDGREGVACSSHRMLAVAPAFDMGADPLRLKIAVTSDYDKEVVEHGWFALRQYADYLKSRGIVHTALVVTKIKFDPNTAYPKLLFALDRVLTQDEVGVIQQALKNPKVAELLAEKWTAAGSNGTPIDESDIKPHGLEGAYADGWAVHPDNAGYSFKGSEVISNEDLAARYPAPEPKAEAPAIPASEQVIEHVPAAPEPAAAPPPVVATHDPLTSAMADGWAVHPDNPAYYFKGSEVVATADVMAKYPAPAVAAPAAPVAPAAPPAPPAEPVKTPEELATLDGWAVHPDNPAYWFKGGEVLPTAEVLGKFGAAGGASAGTPTAETPAAAGPTATTAASPSSGEVPADVQGLLDKWAG